MKRSFALYFIQSLVCVGSVFSSETGKTVYVPRLLSMDSTYDVSQYEYFRDTCPLLSCNKIENESNQIEVKSSFSKNSSGQCTQKITAVSSCLPWHFSLAANPIYEQSVGSADLAEVFLLNHQQRVLVTQAGGAGTIYPNNIYSEWLGLNATPSVFQQSFSFAPQRKVWGTFLNFYTSYRYVWGSILVPIICAEHNLNFSQSSLSSPGNDPQVKTVYDALKQSSFQYGRMKNVNKKWGVDDIKFKLGSLYANSQSFQGRAYVQTLIPTGKYNQATYIFNPRVGSRHGGLGCGLNFFWIFTQGSQFDLSLIADANWIYRFQGDELRSFDLKNNGSFSRYLLLVNRGAATTALDGINKLTAKATISARNAVEGLIAIHSSYKKFNAEFGFDVFYRQAEKVKFKSWPSEDLGILNPGEIFPNGTTSSKATIGTSFVQATLEADSTFVSLTKDDINNASAAHDAYFTNKFYMSFAGDVFFGDVPALLGVFGSYEFGTSNAELSQWSLAAQIAAKF